MAYRDDQEALRARLEATEQRLRLAEEELADAKRQVEEPLPIHRSEPAAVSSRIHAASAAGRLEGIADALEHWVRGMGGAGLLVMVTYVLFSLDVFSPFVALALALLFGVGGPGLLYLWLQQTAPSVDAARARRPSVIGGLVGGWVVALAVVGLSLWLRPDIAVLYDVLATVAVALGFSLATILFLLLRRPARQPWLEVDAEPSSARAAPRTRVDVQVESRGDGEAEADLDDGNAEGRDAPPTRRARTEQG